MLILHLTPPPYSWLPGATAEDAPPGSTSCQGETKRGLEISYTPVVPGSLLCCS